MRTQSCWPRSGRACKSPSTSRAETRRSNTDLRTIDTISSPRWQPISFGGRWPSLSPMDLQHGRPRQQQRRSLSSALAAELVRLPVEVLVAGGGPVSALAAKAATKTIPIVFTIAADPVKSGLVTSLNRPGGNITGTAGLTSELDAKRLELLHRLLPKASVIGVLVNPNRPAYEGELRELQAKAGDMKLTLVVQKAGAEGEIDAAIEALTRQKVGALLITADPFFNSRRAQVIAAVTRNAIPAIYQWREFAAAGGLMSYGPSIVAAYHQAGVYVGRILKGAKPSDLPVVMPTRFELVINLKTAKALGIDVPPTLLAIANQVIE